MEVGQLYDSIKPLVIVSIMMAQECIGHLSCVILCSSLVSELQSSVQGLRFHLAAEKGNSLLQSWTTLQIETVRPF